MRQNKEAEIHRRVTRHIKLHYPTVIFRSDHEGGRKRHPAEQARIKALNSGRAWPDLFIAEPVGKAAGLFIELKAANIYLKDGTTLKADTHLKEQAEMLVRLKQKGYEAVFAVSYEAAILIIDQYLKPLLKPSKSEGDGIF